MSTSVCKNCDNKFLITNEDKSFYKKISLVIAEPTLCPDCRSQRRLAFRNERTLYKSKCNSCNKDIISMYSGNKQIPIYCPGCFWSDKWDPCDYGADFDSSRPFFEQFQGLQDRVPRISLQAMHLENSPYVNFCWHLKNCHLCFNVGFSEDILFCDTTYHSRNILDCSNSRELELCYEIVDSKKCFNSAYLINCFNCYDAYFSYDCHQCSNIAFCHNLRNKKNHVFNKPVSKEEFKKMEDEIKNGSYKKIQKFIDDFYKKNLTRAIHRLNNNINVENCSGNYILNSKNCHNCYECDECQDLKFCNRMDERVVTSMDVDNASITELAYECMSISGNNIKFGFMNWHVNDSIYCDSLKSCSNCFGCISLQSKDYCILNKQYSKKKYEELIPKIIEYMKKTGEWGEFFPISISPFCYNETMAQDFFPLSKEKALSRGYYWKEKNPKEYQPQNYTIPDNINEITDTIINEILVCGECGKNYKIIPQEFYYYQRQSFPIPRKCPDCRYHSRIAIRNPRKLWGRKCDKCEADIITTYASNRPERVYCEKCYLEEVY